MFKSLTILYCVLVFTIPLTLSLRPSVLTLQWDPTHEKIDRREWKHGGVERPGSRGLSLLRQERRWKASEDWLYKLGFSVLPSLSSWAPVMECWLLHTQAKTRFRSTLLPYQTCPRHGPHCSLLPEELLNFQPSDVHSRTVGVGPWERVFLITCLAWGTWTAETII